MTERTNHTGFYVTARIDGGTSNARVSWLLGPFDNLTAAMMMVQPVSHSCRHLIDDPRFQFAAFGTAKLTYPITKPLPPGRLDLTLAVDEIYCNLTIRAADTLHNGRIRRHH